ncbi:PREDICTED: traB domain-containing protein isoform X1 [Trachymyrmex cornetzi]|uniref:traB domain-containing protein isoform X1 n=1 Tax=Trachymyrmex cornetzi TaxID=471704 RepID=UPI00084F7452|nr:PREDICTED: traB domain-containing protein isoform X1 [Trachymyrmex cornetzi]
MASISTKADKHVGGDQKENDLLTSIKDKHYNLIDERGDHDTSKRNAQNVTKELIAKESGRGMTRSDSQSATQSSCTLSIVSTDDNRDDDNKVKSTESSDSEMILIDEGIYWPCIYNTENIGSNADSNIQNKGSNIGNTVSELREYDPTIDERLPETVTLLTTPDGGKLYLVGTAHFSVESQNDVSKIIQAVQPHIVAVELCRARVGILQLDEEVLFGYAKNIDYKTIMDTIKREGLYDGLLHILLLRMAAHVAKELGMPPGGEFRRAFEEAKKVPNCIIHLADRPINITMQRAIRSLSWWQTIKLGWKLAVMKDSITQEDVELCKQRSMLDEIIANMKEKFPVLGEVFVKERDIYLTNSLQLSCLPHCVFNHSYEPARVVGIVGLGHTPGIIENWGKVKPSDIPPIMRIPPPSLSGKILKQTVKASVVGVVIYIGYRVVAIPAAITFQSFKSSVQGLLQVGVVR